MLSRQVASPTPGATHLGQEAGCICAALGNERHLQRTGMPCCIPSSLIRWVDVLQSARKAARFLMAKNKRLVAYAGISTSERQVSMSCATMAFNACYTERLLGIMYKSGPEAGVTLEFRAKPKAVLSARAAALHHRTSSHESLVVLEYVHSELPATLPLRPMLQCLASNRFHAEVARELDKEVRQHVPSAGHVPRSHGEVQLPVRQPVIFGILGHPIHPATLRAEAKEASSVEDLVFRGTVRPCKASSHDLRFSFNLLPAEWVRICRCCKQSARDAAALPAASITKGPCHRTPALLGHGVD
mmetsp:Transcript_7235/g.20064  ORF Transcript_7235/g.20064 Transcript_7235/m.20064 type:complete len:301 (+) Transcript_7235:82-984(+)